MKRFKNILCIVEPNTDNTAMLERTMLLAKSNGAALMVASVTADLSMEQSMFKMYLGADLHAEVIKERAAWLESVVASLPHEVEIQTKVLSGIAFLEIIYEVLRNGHDLVVKTPKDLDWVDHTFGGEDMHLLRKCPCPVWMIRPDVSAPFRNILAAVDISGYDPSEEEDDSLHQLNRQILQIAGALAASDAARLHVVHAIDAPFESLIERTLKTREAIDQFEKNIKGPLSERVSLLIKGVIGSSADDAMRNVDLHTHLIKGVPSQVITTLANQVEADLIVMGTVGRTGIPGFIIGNTAENVLDKIDCSVLAIKPAGFVSPVEL